MTSKPQKNEYYNCPDKHNLNGFSKQEKQFSSFVFVFHTLDLPTDQTLNGKSTVHGNISYHDCTICISKLTQIV